jgi:16S rRNA (cytosine967-C5)-methyltransferase
VKKIEKYSSLQRKIVSNIVHHLRPGGFMVYITCSVFKKENENVAEFIEEKFVFESIKMELLKGYDKKSDSMFVALFRKAL